MIANNWKRSVWPMLAALAALGTGSLFAADAPPLPDPFQSQPPVSVASAGSPAAAGSQGAILYRVREGNERLDITVNTSRILALDAKIPKVQVNNPELLDLRILSPTEIQISGRKAGVTQLNIWTEDDQVRTVTVVVTGDVQELTMILQKEFPSCMIRVTPLANSLLLSGYVDHPQNITRIVEIAQQYSPKVLNNMVVGGVQQVLLHVKVMEVSRTKMRNLGFDFAKMTNGNLVISGVSGLISAATGSVGGGNFSFNIANGDNTFLGVLDALRRDNLMKVLAEPTLVTISGRAAYFQVGGEFPILVPQGYGTVSIEYKKFGTQVDFVPIVLGNGKIHLDVKPMVSEIDSSRSVTISNNNIPGLRTRQVETGVEMTAGQTLAIAGLVQQREEAENKGFPIVSEVPYLGALFRRVQHSYNEIELLILVTPEVVEAMDASQVPQCGPGTRTTSPGDCDLYLKGHLEVPRCCPPGAPGTMSSNGNGMDKPLEVVPPAPTPAPAAQQTSGVRVQNVTVGGGLHDQPAVQTANPVTRNQPGRSPAPDSQMGPVARRPAAPNAEPGFIGPVGYDVK